MFSLPSSVGHAGLNGRFDPDFGLEECEREPTSPTKLVRESNKWLKRYGYEPLTVSDFRKEVHYISSEVGDDEETASDNKAFIALQLVNHQMYGMKVSVEDTSISSRFGNFAEDLIILPDGYGQTYLNVRKTGRTEDMSFLDVPKLRLGIDIRPMRMDHSGTNDGKAAMVGSRLQWIPLNSPFRGTYEVFNLFQDVNLGLIRDKKFPYLPSSLGGYGKEPPFRNEKNLERFIKAFKQGSHSELIRNIVNRTVNFLSDLSDGKDPPKDPLLSHIVRFQSSFHDWIKGKSIYAPVTWLDVPTEVGKHRVARLGDSSLQDEVLIRLLAEKRLVTENQLQVAVEHNELCKSLLGAENVLISKKIRDEMRMKWNSFSVFSLENYGMIEEITLDSNRLWLKKLRDIDVSLFFKLVKEFRYNLRFILGKEFVYWPEAMDEIYERGPMKVHFQMSPLTKMGNRGFAAERSEFSSDYEDIEEKDAIDQLETWLRGSCKGPVPTTVLNDDTAIINECSKHPFNIIITDDIKLCKEANRKVGPIFRVPTRWYYESTYFGVSQHWSEYLEMKTPGKTWTEHSDSGSIKSFEELNFRDGVLLSRPARQSFSVFKTINEKDGVILSEFEDYDKTGPPADAHTYFFDRSNILRLRNPRTSHVRGKAPKGDQVTWKPLAGSNWR